MLCLDLLTLGLLHNATLVALFLQVVVIAIMVPFYPCAYLSLVNVSGPIEYLPDLYFSSPLTSSSCLSHLGPNN